MSWSWLLRTCRLTCSCRTPMNCVGPIPTRVGKQLTYMRTERVDNTETISVRPKSIMEYSSPDLTHRLIKIKPSIDSVGITSTVWTPNQTAMGPSPCESCGTPTKHRPHHVDGAGKTSPRMVASLQWCGMRDHENGCFRSNKSIWWCCLSLHIFLAFMSCSIDPLKKRSNLLLRNVRPNEKEFARVATWDLLLFDSFSSCDSHFWNENSACLFGKYDQT